MVTEGWGMNRTLDAKKGFKHPHHDYRSHHLGIINKVLPLLAVLGQQLVRTDQDLGRHIIQCAGPGGVQPQPIIVSWISWF